MGELFGTDGIRGLANTYPMTPEVAVNAGRAAVLFFRKYNHADRPKIIIGRDTRISGPMLESAILAGICSMGGDAFCSGVMPTPGVAFLVRSEGADAGIVISASHNPFEDNGIKFFKGDGYKLSDDEEAALETLIVDGKTLHHAELIKETGKIIQWGDAVGKYRAFLEKTFSRPDGLKGIKLVLDCSNGATSHMAPELFSALGADVTPLSNRPDGMNINADCGSQHPENLAKTVLQVGADIGLAFDGDGDRLIAVDEKGNVLTGDQVIAICAIFLNKNKQLKNQTVVSTVMSNIGLGLSLEHEGIRHMTCDVGDRYVMEEMLKAGAVVGGEDSGHIIFLDHHTTGDGMLAALQLLHVLTSSSSPLSKLAETMTVFPQVLMNVAVASKPDISTIPDVSRAIQSIENKLNKRGRVLVRYSGTQPVCRVMVEAQAQTEAETYARDISAVIRDRLG